MLRGSGLRQKGEGKQAKNADHVIQHQQQWTNHCTDSSKQIIHDKHMYSTYFREVSIYEA